MKKVIAISIIVLIFALIVFGIMFYIQKHQKPLAVADVLPAGAIFYVQAVDLEQNIQDFVDTKFVKEFAQIDFNGAMKMLGAKEQELALYQSLVKQVTSEQNSMILSKLFGREAAVAFHPGRMLKGVSGMEKIIEMLSNISVVTRLNSGVKFIELLTASISKMDSRITETTEEYEGKMVRLLKVDGLFVNIGYVRFNDLLIFGIGDKAAKRAIDSIKDKATALAQDPTFLASQERILSGAESIGFFHYEKFMQTMKDSLLELSAAKAGMNNGDRENMEKGFANTQGFKVVSFSGKFNEVVLGRFDMSYDSTQFSDDVQKFYSFSAQKNHSLSFIPRTAVLYSWNAMADLRVYWENLKEQMEAGTEGDGAAQSFMETGISMGVKALGMNVGESLTLLTNEFGWYFLGVELSEFVPLPKGVLFLGVSNMDQMRAFIEKELDRKGGLRIAMESYNGVEIGYLESVPFMVNIQPAYCVINNYLLISTHQQFLKEAIDVVQGGAESLGMEKPFLRGEYGLTSAGNAVFTLKISKLVDEVQKVLVWANEWADVQYARHQAFKAGAEKRLSDVIIEVDEKRKELGTLEGMMVDVSEKKEVFVMSSEEMAKVGKELEFKKDFETAVKKSVEALAEEESQFLNIRNDETMRLPENGLKRLKIVQEELEKKRPKYEEVKKDVLELEQRYQEIMQVFNSSDVLVKQLAELELNFQKKRNEMKVLEEIRDDLEGMIKGYDDSNLPTPEQRKMVLEKLINPALDAFGHVGWVGAKTTKTVDYIRSDVFMEVK